MSDAVPDPLVPAEVDLRGHEFMPYYGDRLRESDLNSRATDAEYRAAHNLWWSSWKQVPAASLPDDDVVLARLADLGRDLKTWRKVRAVALRGFVLCSDGRRYHTFLSLVAKSVWAKQLRSQSRISRRLMIGSGEWQAIRTRIFERDNYTCAYCSARGGRLECDHVFPVVRGGQTIDENLVAACFDCNRSKGAKTVAEWRH